MYEVTKGHDGYIDVDSEPGQGTTFSIYFPALKKRRSVERDISPRAVEGTGTILLVDDEEVILQVGSALLKELKYSVLETRNGKEAVHVYRENKESIDLIILDMIMPEMGGKETYDRIKEIDPHGKVLLSSGYGVEG